MKKALLFLLLLAGFVLAQQAQAYQYANLTNSAAADVNTEVLYFRTSDAAATRNTPSSYLGGQAITGKKILLTKLRFFPNVTAGTALTSFTLWDAPNGLTYSTGTVQLLKLWGLNPSASGEPYDIPFKADPADIATINSPLNGYMVKGALVVQTAGTNTVNAQAEYLTFPNTTFPGVTP